MIITCPHCKKEHHIDEQKIPPNVQMAKCKVCGNLFSVKSQITPPEEPAQKKETGHTRTIAISLSKGGVGKTTTAVNLSAGLAYAGYKVLLMDTDTQGQASYMLGVTPKGGLTELLTGELSPEEAIYKARQNLWILSGGRSLAGVKRMIDRKDFGGEKTLAESLADTHTDYDYVIVDTSPGWDPLTVNVLFYVTELLIPVSLEVMTLQGLVEFFKSVSSIQKYRPELSVRYIVPTFLDMRVKNKAQSFLDRLNKHYSQYMCPPIRYNNTISQTPMYGKTIFEYAPGSKGAEDYKELVKKVTNNDDLFK